MAADRVKRPGRRSWLGTLAVVTRRLTAAATFEEASREMVEILAGRLEAATVAYHEAGPGHDTLSLVHAAGPQADALVATGPCSTDAGLFGVAFRSAGTVLAQDVHTHPDYVASLPSTRAELVVPLIDGRELVGVLDLQVDTLAWFSPLAVEVVEAIAAQAVVVRQAALLHARRERQIAEQDAVHRTALDILAARPSTQTLRYVAEQMRVLSGADEAAIHLTESDGAHLRLAFSTAAGDAVGSVLAFGEAVAGRVAETRSALVTDHDAAAGSGGRTSPNGATRGCVAAVPLSVGERVVGVAVVETRSPDHVFGADAVRTLELLATPAALAIENARQADDRAAHLAGAAQVARTLSTQTDAVRTREAICEAAVQVTGCRSAALFEPDGDGCLVATAHVNTTATRMSIPLGRPSLHAWAFLTGSPRFVGRTEVDPQVSPEWIERTSTRALLVQPVLREHRAIGVLGLYWGHEVPDLPDRTRSVVALLADDAAVAIGRAELFARLDHLARCDQLTGVPNRRAWDEELPRYLERARRDGRPLVVAMLDLDHFKEFNDVQGHQRGDMLLQQVATAWEGELREGDLLARYGGEEFAVILPDCRLDDSLPIIERLRGATPAGQTCSAGVAAFDGGESADPLVARADAALYEAKVTGRNRTVAAGSDDPTTPATGTLAGWTRWAALVPRLLQERSMTTAYQPVVPLAGGAPMGFEALARPVGEAAQTSVEGLFAAARYRGLGRDLDWLCRRAALAGARWLPPGLPLFVNVGVSALLDPLHDVDHMLLLLEWAGRSPRDVVLEITEREAVRDMNRFADVLASYRTHGFRFAVDDVGEGHSTLELLVTAAPEFIKVARTLLVASRSAGARSAIAAVVAFAEGSGASVIAEGVQTHGERRRLLDLGVTLGQGTLLGVPRFAAGHAEPLAVTAGPARD